MAQMSQPAPVRRVMPPRRRENERPTGWNKERVSAGDRPRHVRHCSNPRHRRNGHVPRGMRSPSGNKTMQTSNKRDQRH